MLQNPLYLGEIWHKKLTFPGQHQAVVKMDLWDKVQKQLVSNRPPDAVHGGSAEVSWLTGLLFDGEGKRFTPSHTTRRGRHYRYYVPMANTQGRKVKRASPFRLSEGGVGSKSELVQMLTVAISLIINKNPPRLRSGHFDIERAKRERDVTNLRWLLGSFNWPTSDAHLASGAKYLSMDGTFISTK